MNIFKLEEKISLVEELGLVNLTTYFKNVQKQFDCRFEETSLQLIKKKLLKVAYQSVQYKNNLILFFTTS